MARSAAHPADSCRRPHFFKVFLPNLSSQHLSIPPAFREHINGETPSTVSLRGPSGRIWHVHLVDNSAGLCFCDGWKEFVADHSLAAGDFLVFRYNGSSHFTVLVFDVTACEKKCAFSAWPCGEEIVVLEGSEGGASSGEEASKALVLSPARSSQVAPKRKRRSRGTEDCLSLQGSPRKRHSPCNKNGAKRPRLRSGRATIHKSKPSPRSRCNPKSGPLTMPRRSIAIARQKGKTRSPSSSKKAGKAAPRVKRGAGDKRSIQRTSNKKPVCLIKSKSQNKRVAKTSFRFGTLTPRSTNKKLMKCVETGSKKRKVPSNYLVLMKSSRVRRRGEGVVQGLRIGSLLSQRRPVTKKEVDRALEKAKSFESENPFTLIVMREAYVYLSFFLHIPTSFVEEHLPNDTQKMTLWDPDGETWIVTYSCYRNCGRFSGGWGKFSKAHNLEENDVCIFELIETNQMRVHIFRVVEELTPSIRVLKSRI